MSSKRRVLIFSSSEDEGDEESEPILLENDHQEKASSSSLVPEDHSYIQTGTKPARMGRAIRGRQPSTTDESDDSDDSYVGLYDRKVQQFSLYNARPDEVAPIKDDSSDGSFAFDFEPKKGNGRRKKGQPQEKKARSSQSDSPDDSGTPSRLVASDRPKSPTPPSSPDHMRSIGSRKGRRSTKADKLLKKLEEQRDMSRLQRRVQAVQESYLNNSINCSSDISFEEEKVILVKFRWLMDVFKINMLKTSQFNTLKSTIRVETEIPEEELFLSLNNKIVDFNDTPLSLKLDITHVIDCNRQKLAESGSVERGAQEEEEEDENVIRIKIQAKNMRQPLILPIHKLSPLTSLIPRFAEHRGVDMACVRFKFDDEVITDADTPSSLDMEDGDIVDAIVVE